MRIILCLLVVLSLEGCTVGSGDFSCKGYPEQMMCMDVEHVYASTNGRSSGVLEIPKTSDTSPKKIRIWIAPWETSKGHYVSASYVDTDLSMGDDGTSIELIDKKLFNPIGEKNEY